MNDLRDPELTLQDQRALWLAALPDEYQTEDVLRNRGWLPLPSTRLAHIAPPGARLELRPDY